MGADDIFRCSLSNCLRQVVYGIFNVNTYNYAHFSLLGLTTSEANYLSLGPSSKRLITKLIDEARVSWKKELDSSCEIHHRR